jgi:hypothetical protein
MLRPAGHALAEAELDRALGAQQREQVVEQEQTALREVEQVSQKLTRELVAV